MLRFSSQSQSVGEIYVKCFLSNLTAYAFNTELMSDFLIPYTGSKQYPLTEYDIFCRVLRAEILISFMPTNSTNNTLVLIKGGITSSHIVPDGAYTISSFIPALALTDYTLTYSSTTGIYTLQSNDNQPFYISPATTCYDQIGCVPQSQLFSDANGKLVLPKVANFYGARTINVRLPQITLDNEAFGPTNNGANILETMTNDVPPFSCLVFNNANGSFQQLFPPSSLLSFRLQLTDDQGNLLNFGGVSPSLTLEFKYVSKKGASPLSNPSGAASLSNPSGASP